VLASFWAGVGGKLADRWASAAVPALIFWLGGLLAYAYHRNGISPITRSLARWTTPEQVAALVVALLVVGASAIVVQRLTLPWLRLLEGYWPGWCGPVLAGPQRPEPRESSPRRALHRALPADMVTALTRGIDDPAEVFCVGLG
jgi:hypothetical protein